MPPKDKPQNHCDGWQMQSHYHPKEEIKTVGALQLCPECLERYRAVVRSYTESSGGVGREFTMVGPSGWS